MHSDNRFWAATHLPQGLFLILGQDINASLKAAGNGSVKRITNRQNIISKPAGFENYIYLNPIN